MRSIPSAIQPLRTFFRFGKVAALVAALTLLQGCGGEKEPATAEEAGRMDAIAESYVKLVLSVGQLDADYVDAYYGPQAWRTEAEAGVSSAGQLQVQAASLIEQLDKMNKPDCEMDALRYTYLSTQLGAVQARLRMLAGEILRFDEESKALYDAVAPTHDDDYFLQIADSLDPLLPGEGTLIERWVAFRSAYVIPPDRLDTVFRTAIEACKERSAVWLDLPAAESFNLEYVTDKNWSG